MDTGLLQNTVLFSRIKEDDIETALKELNAAEKRYKKGSVILHAGRTTDRMGIVLFGSVTIESNDIWGNRTILSHVGKGQFFAETYALLTDEPMLVDATANEDCGILFLEINRLTNTAPGNDEWRVRILNNLLTISAHKNLALSGRSFHISPKSIRGRVMSYLNSVSLQKGSRTFDIPFDRQQLGSRTFDIPFDRQQLADYLNIERTALSKELGRMQKEGIISVRKSHFIILSTQE